MLGLEVRWTEMLVIVIVLGCSVFSVACEAAYVYYCGGSGRLGGISIGPVLVLEDAILVGSGVDAAEESKNTL